MLRREFKLARFIHVHLLCATLLFLWRFVEFLLGLRSCLCLLLSCHLTLHELKLPVPELEGIAERAIWIWLWLPPRWWRRRRGASWWRCT